MKFGSGLDIVSVGVLLAASSTNLEQALETATYDRASKESLRHSGAILIFGIDYDVKGRFLFFLRKY